jgi:DNA-binding Lrp family transcriptional regulator
MDKYNEQILFELTRNSNISNLELAERIGLSPSACLRRVQDLERKKVITGYKATIDTEQLGIGFKAFVTVGLSVHTKAAQTQFEQAITLSKEVLECHNVTGAFEYILRVETTDLKSYKQFHTNVLGDIEQVATITTHVVMASVKDS